MGLVSKDTAYGTKGLYRCGTMQVVRTHKEVRHGMLKFLRDKTISWILKKQKVLRSQQQRLNTLPLPLRSATIMSSTPGPSTLTFDTILFESKLRKANYYTLNEKKVVSEGPNLPVPVNNWASDLASTYAPPPENSLLAQTGDMAILMDWFCKKYNVSKPLPLGGPPGQVTIQFDFFNKDLEYLRYGRKSGRLALLILKMKAAYYPNVGHTSEGDRRAVRTHMRILSVVKIEVFSLYGYDYMKKIVLRRADLKEYTIAERDFKYLYPSDFKDLYLLNLQGHLNQIPPKDKKILTTATQLNLTKPRWDAIGFEFKHEFTVIDSPRAVTFRDKYGVQMIMRFNEIHKFSDGTLQQIDEALDYQVKEFKVNRMNPGLNTRFWIRNDVDRSKEFMFSIQKWLKTRRIFRNLESFVGGRIREGDYRLLKRTK
ncbi:hypothetical protein Tco_1191797 [Tanacetum coccineum]